MTMIKVMNAISMMMSLLANLLCASISVESFREGHIEHGVVCSVCSLACLFCYWWSSRIIEFCNEIEKEDNDEAED